MTTFTEFEDAGERWRKRVASSVVVTERVTRAPRHRLESPGTSLDFTDGVLGRRDDVEMTVDHPRTSRRHAYLRWTERGWLVHDLGSTNGTLVNGVRLAPGQEHARLLAPEDVVVFGTGGPSFTVRLRETAYVRAAERAS